MVLFLLIKSCDECDVCHHALGTCSFLFCHRPHGLSSTISLSSSLSSSFSPDPEVFSWTDMVIIFHTKTIGSAHINTARKSRLNALEMTRNDPVRDTWLRVDIPPSVNKSQTVTRKRYCKENKSSSFVGGE